MERLVAPVEWKAARGDSGGLLGYASTFGNVDQGGDVVEPGAFRGSVARINAGEHIPLLADHVPSTSNVLGTIYAAREDKHGLEIEARFASTARAQEVRTLLLEGHLSKMSIGYSAEMWDYEMRGEREIRLLKQVTLWETSVVVFPMNPRAEVTSAKAALEGTVDAIEAEALALRVAAATAWLSQGGGMH